MHRNRMKFLHRNAPRLSGFSSKGSALTSPMTTLWLGIVFVAILFAIFTARRSWTEAKEEEKSRMLHSGYLSDPPLRRELGDPPPDPDSLLEPPSDLIIFKNEVIELEDKHEPIEIQRIELELDVRLSEKPDHDPPPL